MGIETLKEEITQEATRLRNTQANGVVNAGERAFNIVPRITAQERIQITGGYESSDYALGQALHTASLKRSCPSLQDAE